jgi:hypothetical protein
VSVLRVRITGNVPDETAPGRNRVNPGIGQFAAEAQILEPPQRRAQLNLVRRIDG